jgi:hypothetical protein
MKGYTGKLVIQFTATVRSLSALDRRIAKVMRVAEREIGGELWEVPELRALPGPIPLGYQLPGGRTRRETSFTICLSSKQTNPTWQMLVRR